MTPFATYKLGALPQLECWNAGILEEWILGYWSVGLMALIVLTIKLKMDNILLKNPLFHHSTIPLFHD
jgi:hypothetical protein